VVPWIALTWDWRAAFVAAGCVGLLWLLLWLPLYNGPEKVGRLTADDLARIRDDEQTADAGAPVGLHVLLRDRRAWSFIVGKMLTDPVWWFFLIWLPDFFKKTRGLDIKGSRVYLVSIYGIVTVLSIAGGWLAGALVRRGFTPTRARKVTMLVSALAVVPIVAVTHVGTWTAVVLIGVAGSAHQAWSANLFTTVSDMFPKRAVATLVGVGGMAGSITGIAFPLVVGTLLDRFQAAGNVTAGYAILFLVCGLAYLVAFAVGQLLAPSFEPAPIGGGPVGH
jgi:ACS family hexuronate transporter-like MFS transporter